MMCNCCKPLNTDSIPTDKKELAGDNLMFSFH